MAQMQLQDAERQIADVRLPARPPPALPAWPSRSDSRARSRARVKAAPWAARIELTCAVGHKAAGAAALHPLLRASAAEVAIRAALSRPHALCTARSSKSCVPACSCGYRTSGTSSRPSSRSPRRRACVLNKAYVLGAHGAARVSGRGRSVITESTHYACVARAYRVRIACVAHAFRVRIACVSRA